MSENGERNGGKDANYELKCRDFWVRRWTSSYKHPSAPTSQPTTVTSKYTTTADKIRRETL